MNKTVLVTVFFLLYINIFAQQIHWANPLPYGEMEQDMAFFDNARGIVCGDLGWIAYTEDGGNKWHCVKPVANTKLCEIDIVGSRSAFVWSDKQLLHSNDYGRTWSLKYTLDDAFTFLDIDMHDSLRGTALLRRYISGYNKHAIQIGKTMDGGLHWEFIRPEGLSDNWSAPEGIIAFEDNDNGVFIDQEFRIAYYTVDGGQSFQYKYDPNFGDLWYLNDISYCNGQYIVAGGYYDGGKSDNNAVKNRAYGGALVINSIDGGVNWDFMLHSGEFFYEFKRIKTLGDSTLIAYGDCGSYEDGCYSMPLAVSEDFGLNWEYTYLSPDMGTYADMPHINVLGFKPDRSALAIIDPGWYRDFYIESQELINWEFKEKYPVWNVSDIFFLDGLMYFLSEKSIYTAGYGLGSFELVESFEDVGMLNNVATYSGQMACVSSLSSPFTFFVTDQDNNWIRKASQITEFQASAISYPKSDRIYFFDKETKQLFCSENQNEDLEQLNIPEEDCILNDMVWGNSSGYLVGGISGNSGGYFKTINEGENWDYYSFSTKTLHKAFLIDDQLMYVADNAVFPNIWSVDLQNDEIIELVFTAPDTGSIIDFAQTATGITTILFQSKEKRYMISQITSSYVWEIMDYCPGFNALCEDPSGKVIWAGGDFGRLLYLGDGLPVGIEPIPTHDKQQAFSVEGNPFSNSLQINVNLEYQGEATLQLTDMNGKLVRQSKIMLHGRASRFLIQTRDLAPGAYVCTLVAGTKHFNEKVVKK